MGRSRIDQTFRSRRQKNKNGNTSLLFVCLAGSLVAVFMMMNVAVVFQSNSKAGHQDSGSSVEVPPNMDLTILMQKHLAQKVNIAAKDKEVGGLSMHQPHSMITQGNSRPGDNRQHDDRQKVLPVGRKSATSDLIGLLAQNAELQKKEAEKSNLRQQAGQSTSVQKKKDAPDLPRERNKLPDSSQRSASLGLKEDRFLFSTSAIAQEDVVSDLFVFMHVPKCSGSSFKKLLCEMTEPHGDVHWFNSCKEWQSFNAPGCGPAEWGGTHCSHAELQDCLETGRAKWFQNSNPFKGYVQIGHRPMFVTILRDPVERVISEFFWWKGKSPCPRLHEWGRPLCEAGQLGLRPWADHPRNLAHNRQVRFFTMEGEKAPINKHYNLLSGKKEPQWECSSFFAIYAEDYWTKHYSMSMDAGLVQHMNNDQKIIDAAIETLDTKFWFVGIQEEYQLSLEKFAYLLGKILNTHINVANASKSKSHKDAHIGQGKKDVSQSDRERIKSMNKADYAIYDYVREKLVQIPTLPG